MRVAEMHTFASPALIRLCALAKKRSRAFVYRNSHGFLSFTSGRFDFGEDKCRAIAATATVIRSVTELLVNTLSKRSPNIVRKLVLELC